MKEDDFNGEDHGLMTDKELDEIDGNFKRMEIEGVQNILKYFDRIHDKLFNFNNILIGGYFALSQIYESFSIYGIIIPLVNLGILLFIEYRMMEKSRFEADIRKKTKEEIDKHGTTINKTTLYSLLAIFSTTIVVGIFIFNLFTIEVTEIPEPIETTETNILYDSTEIVEERYNAVLEDTVAQANADTLIQEIKDDTTTVAKNP